MRSKVWLCLLGVGLWAGAVQADGWADADRVPEAEADAVSGTHDLDVVVVTATRTPKALKDLPVVTKVITSEVLQKVDATNIMDLLQQEVPGLEFSYSMGSIVMNMGGFDGNNILFLVDGERLAGETMNNVDFARLNLSNIDHIEIVKGAASTLYGSQAMGGVINIITKTNTEPWALNLNSKYDTQMGWRHGGVASFKAGKFNSMTDVQYTDQPSIELSDNEESSLTRIYASQALNLKEKLIYSATDRLKLTGRAAYMKRDRKSGSTSKEMYRDLAMGLKANYALSGFSNLEVAYSFDQYDKSDYGLLTHLDVRDYSNRQNVVRALSNTQFSALYTELTLGGDFMYDFLQSYQFENDGHKDQRSADVFAQAEYKPSARFSLIAGGRYDYFSASAKGHFTGKLSAMYKFDALTLRGGYASAFRAPSLKEMYMNFFMGNIFYIYGNEDLKPETNRNVSLSFERSGSLPNDWGKYNLTAAGNYNWFDHYITTTYTTDRTAMRYTNVTDIQILNVDVTAMASLNCGVALQLNYAYVDETVKSKEVDLTAARPHSLTWRLCYDHQFTDHYGLYVALTGRYLGPFDSEYISSTDDLSQTTAVHYDGYQIWKLSLSHRIWKGIRLNMALDNLFNFTPKVYQFNSPTTTGLNGSVGVSLDIDQFFK